ncbi:MAG: MBL fold metallo-hydrolase [Ruminococcus sp.]|nr:MBL fold metallo-hydrolase [Ruminococcus sp.]MBQ9673729.1 MBL fold metallo-hydrolase [Ruminococcus sp.]
MAKLIPLFSGSKGNSYYIGSGSGGVLIDAGRSCKQILTALDDNNIDINKIRAVFVTHEHIDHCSALRVLVKKTGMKVYATEGTMNALIRDNRLEPNAVTEVLTSPVAVGDMLVEHFSTNHDTPQPCCYRVKTSDNRCAMVATDLGTITDNVRSAFNGVDALVLESNHDVNMLKNGIYPQYLKQRILSDCGHLSNRTCAEELPDIIKNGTMRIVLGHLSQENNRPDIAMNTSIKHLADCGFKRDYDYTLDLAPEVNNGKVILF